MHLHALRLSDICTADGRYLTNNAMEVQLDPYRCTRSLWPHTRRPSCQPLTLALIAKVFLRSTDTPGSMHSTWPFSPDMADTWLWLSPQKKDFFPFGSIWTFYQVTSAQPIDYPSVFSRRTGPDPSRCPSSYSLDSWLTHASSRCRHYFILSS
jgi:hypothetical protein